jgi:hypothetical protein
MMTRKQKKNRIEQARYRYRDRAGVRENVGREVVCNARPFWRLVNGGPILRECPVHHHERNYMENQLSTAASHIDRDSSEDSVTVTIVLSRDQRDALLHEIGDLHMSLADYIEREIVGWYADHGYVD